MDEFVSFVLTKKDIFYLENSNSYDDIIEHYHLENEDLAIVKLIPPQNANHIIYASKWQFKIIEFPNWNEKVLEKRTKNTLVKRIVKEKIGFQILKKGKSLVKVGHYGKSITGEKGKAIAGHYGTAISDDLGKSITGDFGKSITGDCGESQSGTGGQSISGYFGKSITGDFGQAISGERGTSISGHDGRSITGDYGTATSEDFGESIAGFCGIAISLGVNGTASAGIGGNAKAGEGGEIKIKYQDPKTLEVYTIVGKIGLKGIQADTLYKVEEGKLVKE